MKRRMICVLLSLLTVLSVFSPLAGAAGTTVPGDLDRDAAWNKIQGIIDSFAVENTWTNQSYPYASRNMGLPGTALTGNGAVGISSDGNETYNQKTYRISAVDFWSENAAAFGYRGRSPQGIAGGGLTIQPVSDPITGKAFSEYQNIATGEIITKMNLGNTPVKIVCWLSQESNLLFTQIQSMGSEAQELSIGVWGKGDIPQLPTESGVLEGQNGVWALRRSNIFADETKTTKKGYLSELVFATKVFGGTDISCSAEANKGSIAVTLPAGGTVTAVTAIHCEGGQPVDASAGTAGLAFQNAVALLDTVKAEADVTTNHAKTLEWWKNYYLLSWIDLGDRDLNRAYYGLQYLFACGARDAKTLQTAPGIYGVWRTRDDMGWQDDMHLNYNFQAPYYASYSSNRLNEFSQPMFRTFRELIDRGVNLAADGTKLPQVCTKVEWYVDARPELKDGFQDAILLPVGIKPYTTENFSGPSWNQTLNALFCTAQICAYYRATEDLTWLLEKDQTGYSLYDFLAKTANFYLQWVEKKGPRMDQEFVKDNPSAVGDPQKCPTGFTANYEKYPEYDPASHGENYVYVLFDGSHEGSWEFNPNVTVGNLQHLLDTLMQIGPDTATQAGYGDRFAAWQDLDEHLVDTKGSAFDYKGKTIFGLSEDRMVRLISATVNLEHIHPGYQLGFNTDPEQLQIARNTVDVMGNSGRPGWTMVNNAPKIFTHAARVGYDTNTLLRVMKDKVVGKMLKNNYINDNTHGWEKVGFVEALNTLMCMEDHGIIKAFPFWNGQDAQFHTIRMPGAFLVSSEMKNGKAQYVEVTSEKGGLLQLVLPWDVERYDVLLKDSKGNTIPYETAVTTGSGDQYLKVQTTAGETYSLSCSTVPKIGTPEIPLNLKLDAMPSSDSITVSWERNPKEADPVTYEVSWQLANGPVYTQKTSETSAVLNDLTPGETYTVSVKAYYDESRCSEPSQPLEVTMAPAIESGAVLMELEMPAPLRTVPVNSTLEALQSAAPKALNAMIFDGAKGLHAGTVSVNWDFSQVNLKTTDSQFADGELMLEGMLNPHALTAKLEIRLQDGSVTLVSEKCERINDAHNLTELGTNDWIQYYESNDNTIAYIRKNNNANLISEMTVEQNNPKADIWAGCGDFAILTSWTDGTPVESREATPATNKIGKGQAIGLRYEGNRMTFTVKARPYEQTLVLSLGTWCAKAQLDAYLAHVPEQKVTVTVDNETDKIGGDFHNAHKRNKGAKLVTITFSATDPDEELVVSYGVVKDHDAKKNGQAVIQAVALSGKDPHTHQMTYHEAVAAACETEGNVEYWSCSGCGKNFADEAGTRELTDVTIAALGHDWSEIWEKDETNHWHKCGRCDERKDQAAHTYGEWVVDQEATEEAAGSRHRDCTVCQYQETETIPVKPHTHKMTHHEAVAATCETAGNVEYWSCSGCGKNFADEEGTTELTDLTIEALGHDYGAPTYTWSEDNSTCTAERVCSRDDSHRENTEAIVTSEVTLAPTYTSEGVRTYTAEFNVNWAEKQTKEVSIPKLNRPTPPDSHEPGIPVKPEEPAEKLPFVDVPEHQWYYESVQKAFEENLIDGMDAAHFEPDGTLTVAQAIKLAAALHQRDKTGRVTLENGKDAWFSTYVDYAIANGIIDESYGEWTGVQMNQAITRSEFVKIFHGAIDYYSVINEVADNAIPDVKMDTKNAAEIYTFYRSGILIGSDEKGTFYPDSNIRRSEVATILIRMFDTSTRQEIELK